MGMKEPQTLEEWADFSYFGFNRPWGSKKVKELSNTIPCLTAMLLKYQITERYQKLWQKIALPFLRADAHFRWEHKMFDFPLEWKVVRKYLEFKSGV
jgi:hypothetical protein